MLFIFLKISSTLNSFRNFKILIFLHCICTEENLAFWLTFIFSSFTKRSTVGPTTHTESVVRARMEDLQALKLNQ